LRKRALLVNAYFDPLRRGARPHSIPQSMAPAYLAGALSPAHWDIRLYNEQATGPLHDPDVLGWPDLLVFTGLTCAFDRMLHLTAYARTLNPRVVVAAGGPAIRALPRYARRFFDYVCTGDVEQLREIVQDAFGATYATECMRPRFDLVDWMGRFGYIESSRYCNFRCGFCSLTAEGRPYHKYDLEDIRRDILALGRRDVIIFIDNNFYGNDRAFFLARMDLLQELTTRKLISGWCALVTNDFFLKDENLRLARAAGCYGLFSGVESFEAEALRTLRKPQNLQHPQVDLIRKCLASGITFSYGLIFDVTKRRLHDMEREIDFVLATPDIPLPNYMTLAIPLLGTPYFHECVDQRLLLPRTRLRDLDTLTIALRPLDPLPDVVRFVRGLPGLHGRRARVVRHAAAFYRRYRACLTAPQMKIALSGAFMLLAPYLRTRERRAGLHHAAERTYVSSTETLDPLYTPALPVLSRYASFFEPTMVTDDEGRIADLLVHDLRPAARMGRDQHAAVPAVLSSQL
jgi:hopanoid C-2 methylase